MISTEYEYKQLLNKSEYNALLTLLNDLTPNEDIVQVNYYYDDRVFTLYEQGETLRVRQKYNKLSLERKFNKQYSKNGLRVSSEYCETISDLPAQIIIKGIEYCYIGNLITIRKYYNIDSFLISLDTNLYLGVIDYEIEIETNKYKCIPDFISDC